MEPLSKFIYIDDNLQVISKLAGHEYFIDDKNAGPGPFLSFLGFQNGPIKEVGVNGIQNEPVIAILIDRLKFLDGTFPSDYNKAAIASLEDALKHLQARTKDRKDRGVEGLNKE